MSELKERRQRAMAELIRSGVGSSQEQLADRLSALGFAVTQATISRDIEQLGAIKVRRDGQLGYALPEQVQAVPRPHLAGLLRDFARSIDTAVNLVVIKSPPGSAHLIGVALDHSEYPELVGTVCGDDTIFVACSSAAAASRLASKLKRSGSQLQ